MEFTPESHLKFTDRLDYDFLFNLRLDLGNVIRRAQVTRLRGFLGRLSADPAYTEPISAEELHMTMARQETDYIASQGLVPVSVDASLSDAVGRGINQAVAQTAGIAYELETKWATAVFVEAAYLAECETRLRDDLLRQMIDGQSDADRITAIRDGLFAPDIEHDLRITYTQNQYNLARRAGEIASILAVAFSSDS